MISVSALSSMAMQAVPTLGDGARRARAAVLNGKANLVSSEVGYDRARMAESWKTRLSRWGFNWFPAYRGSGARIEYVEAGWREVRIRVPLNWRTRNYVGTIFGGSMYSAIDPIYMIMLIKMLGADYVVWDKAATIRFLRPGRETLRATFRIDDDELRLIRDEVAAAGKCERLYTVDLVDASGEVCATCEKLLSIRLRR